LTAQHGKLCFVAFIVKKTLTCRVHCTESGGLSAIASCRKRGFCFVEKGVYCGVYVCNSWAATHRDLFINTNNVRRIRLKTSSIVLVSSEAISRVFCVTTHPFGRLHERSISVLYSVYAASVSPVNNSRYLQTGSRI